MARLVVCLAFALAACVPDFDATPAAPHSEEPLPPKPAAALRVMSYNVRFANPDDGPTAPPPTTGPSWRTSCCRSSQVSATAA